MSNTGNINKYAELAAAQKSGNPGDLLLRPGDKMDLNPFNKGDNKLDQGELNDLLISNFLANPGQLPQFLEKGPGGAEFFMAGNHNNLNLAGFDPNLLYALNNSGGGNHNLNPNDPLNQNNLFMQNNSHLLQNNFNLNMYDEMVKNQGPTDYLYANGLLNDKGLLGNAVLGDQGGLFDQQLLFPGFDDIRFKPDLQQAQINGGLDIQNQMLLNNLYGGELGFNNLLLNNMGNLNIEDLYSFPHLSGVPGGGLNFPGINDIKVDRNGQNLGGLGGLGGHHERSGDHGHLGNDHNSLSKANQQALSGGNMFGMPGMKNMMMPGDNLESHSSLLKYITMNQQPQQNQNQNQQSIQQSQQHPSKQDPKNNNFQPQTNFSQQQAQNQQQKLNQQSQQAQDMKMMQNYLNQNPMNSKPGQMNPQDLEAMNRAMLDPFLMGNPGKKLGGLPFEDNMLLSQAEMYNKIREKNRYERSLKIEKYKNKKRNWAKKISYDCRKRVADTRLRIKGRFISKKDTEKIVKLVDGKQEEAFNEKKNLNLDFITNKFNIQNEDAEVQVAKPNISKKFLLTKIDEILSNNRNPLPPKNAQNVIALGDKIKLMLEAKSKKIFKIHSKRFRNDQTIRSNVMGSDIRSQQIQAHQQLQNQQQSKDKNPFLSSIPQNLQGLVENNPYLNLGMLQSNPNLNQQLAQLNAQFQGGPKLGVTPGGKPEDYDKAMNEQIQQMMWFQQAMMGQGMPGMPFMQGMPGMPKLDQDGSKDNGKIRQEHAKADKKDIHPEEDGEDDEDDEDEDDEEVDEDDDGDEE